MNTWEYEYVAIATVLYYLIMSNKLRRDDASEAGSLIGHLMCDAFDKYEGDAKDAAYSLLRKLPKHDVTEAIAQCALYGAMGGAAVKEITDALETVRGRLLRPHLTVVKGSGGDCQEPAADGTPASEKVLLIED